MAAHAPSLWAATAPPGPDCPPLSGPQEADVVIVGAGYTGLSAALHLAAEGKSVRVLDAGEPGHGCSGRNGGQVNPGGARALPDEVVRALGANAGKRFIAIANESCDLVFDLIERHGIECEAVRPGFVQGGWGRTGQRYARRWAEQWQRRGVDVDILDRSRVRDLIGTDAYDVALHDARGGNVQPLAYARGLARAAITSGASVHGGSRVVRVERDGAGWEAVTGAGGVRAEHLLLCTNGYTDGLWPGLAQTIVPVCSFVTATAPLGHNVLATLLPGRHAVSESCRVIVYYRRDREGRFIIGGRGNLSNVGEQGSLRHVQESALRLFPQLAGADWEFGWSGWPAITRDHLPMLIALDENAYAGLGYNGRGVAMATMMGRQLALTVLGEPAALDPRPPRRYPLHSLRQAGISYHLVVNGLRDRLERRASEKRRARSG